METLIFLKLRILLLLTYITVIASQNSLEECSKSFKCINENEYLMCDDIGTGNFFVTDNTTKFCPEGKYCNEENTQECMSINSPEDTRNDWNEILDKTTLIPTSNILNTNTKLPDIENSESIKNDAKIDLSSEFEPLTTKWYDESDIENSNVATLNKDDYTEKVQTENSKTIDKITVSEDMGVTDGNIENTELNNESNVQSTSIEENVSEIIVENTKENQISYTTISKSEDETNSTNESVAENVSTSSSVSQSSAEEHAPEIVASDTSSTDKSSNIEPQNTDENGFVNDVTSNTSDEFSNSNKDLDTESNTNSNVAPSMEESTSNSATDNVESGSGMTASESGTTEESVSGTGVSETGSIAESNNVELQNTDENGFVNNATSSNSEEPTSNSATDNEESGSEVTVPESEAVVETGTEVEPEKNNGGSEEAAESAVTSSNDASKEQSEEANNIPETNASETDVTNSISNSDKDLSTESSTNSNAASAAEESTSNSAIGNEESGSGMTASENETVVETVTEVEPEKNNGGSKEVAESTVTSSNDASKEQSEEANNVNETGTGNTSPSCSVSQISTEKSAPGTDTNETDVTSSISNSDTDLSTESSTNSNAASSAEESTSNSATNNVESGSGMTAPESETGAGVEVDNSNEVTQGAVENTVTSTNDASKAQTENVGIDSDKPNMSESNTVDVENCTSGELFADATDCRKYFVCVATPTNSSKIEKICPIDSAFSESLGRCTRDVSSCGGPACELPGAIADAENPSSFYWCIQNVLGNFSKYHVPCGKSSIFVPELGRCDKVINGTASTITSSEKDILKEDKKKMKLDMKLQKEEEKFALKQQKLKAKEEKKMLKLQLKKEKLDEKMALKEMKAKMKKEKMLKKGTKAGKGTKGSGEIGATFICENEGMFPDPDDCESYFLCAEVKLKLKKFHLKCPLGTVFDVEKHSCDVDTEGKCLKSI